MSTNSKEAPSLLTHTPESDLILYLQDIRGFSQDAASNPRMFTYIVFAVFGAIQAGMILTLGDAWLKKPHRELEESQRPRAKEFIRMFKDLQEYNNWAYFEGAGVAKSTSWVSGVTSVKDLRDALEHPKYDGTHLSCLFIQQDCLRGLDYLDYLITESPRIRKRFVNRHAELKTLIGESIHNLKAISINQTETLSLLDLDPEMPESQKEAIIESAESAGSKALVFENGIPRGIRII